MSNKHMKTFFSGYKPEPYHFKDWDFEKRYGAVVPETIAPLNRDVSGVPVVYQGDKPTCVSCTASWIKSFMEQEHPELSWEWLAYVSQTDKNGASPSKVFKIAKKQGIAENEEGLNADKHKLGAFFYVRLNPQAIYHAMKTSVLAVGLKDWGGVGPHMVVAYDVNASGTALKCKNWWNPKVQEDIEVPFDLVDDCIAFGEEPEISFDMTMPLLEVLVDKISMTPIWKKIVGGILTLLVSAFGVHMYGAGGVPGEYSTQLAQAITSSDTSVPAVSRTLFTGETFSNSDLFHPIAIAIGKGQTREYASCDFFNTTGTFPTFTGCLRGMSALSTSTSITQVSGAAFAHVAGETVTVTNQPGFFRNLVDIFTAQTISGIKTIADSWVFNSFPHASSSLALPSSGGDFATKIYVDNVGAGGFTASNVSSTLGLQAISTGIPDCLSAAACVGINASSSGALAFYPVTGAAYVSVSSTSSTNGGYLKYTFNTLNQIYWDIVSFLADNHTWSGQQIFNATTTFNNDVNLTTSASTGTSIVNKNYVDSNIYLGRATGTAGIAITAGQALFISSTSSLFQTNSSVASSTFQFVGIANTSASVGQTVIFSPPGSINCSQTSLSPGFQQYLNGTAGQVASTPGAFHARIGLAISSTCVQVMMPKFILRGVASIASTGSTFVETGFYPAHIQVIAVNSNASANGFSIGDDTNNNVFIEPSNTNVITFDNIFRSAPGTQAWNVENTGSNTAEAKGTISAKSATGFILDESTHAGGTTYIQWVASSE